MKVWSRKTYVSNTISLLRKVPKTDVAAFAMRDLTGAILSQNLSALGHPFIEVKTLDEFQTVFDDMINTASVNDIDAAATKIIQLSKQKKYTLVEENAIRCATAFLKSSANLATAKRKHKSIKSDEIENGEFLTKLALNAIIEFNTGRDV